MKRKLTLAYFLLATLAYAQSPQGTPSLDPGGFVVDKKLGELIIKEMNLVKSYEGFLCNLLIAEDRKPILSVSRTTYSAPSNLVVRPWFVLNSEISPEGRAEIQAKLDHAKNIDPKDVKRIVSTPLGYRRGRDGSQIRFDFFGAKGKRLMSEWRDQRTGFKLKTILYDEKGKFLTALFYSRLSINGRSECPAIPARPIVKFFKDMRKFDRDGNWFQQEESMEDRTEEAIDDLIFGHKDRP